MTNLERLPFFVLGVLLLLFTIRAVVVEFVVPRPSRSWVTRLNNRTMHAVFRWLAGRASAYPARDRILAVGGPVTILTELLLFVALLLLALTLMVFGVSPRTLDDSAYQAGSTLLTLGILEPVNRPQIAIGLLAAFLGLVVVAVLIGHLLALSSAFSGREELVVASGPLYGQPPWGPEALCRAELIKPSTADQGNPMLWVAWCNRIRETQSVNPVLNYYRSPSPLQNWVVSLLAALDAAALDVTTVHSDPDPHQIRLIVEGTQTLAALRAVHDSGGPDGDDSHAEVVVETLQTLNSTPEHHALVRSFVEDSVAELRMEGTEVRLAAPRRAERSEPGITRDEFDHAIGLMRRAGVNLVEDLDTAWAAFAKVRQAYAPHAYYLAEVLDAVPAPWSGRRYPGEATIWPHLSAEQLPEVSERE